MYGKPYIFLDIDECETDTNNCHELATCIDEVGNFTCTCNDGWEGDGIINCTGKSL